jgi:hypothetical protein
MILSSLQDDVDSLVAGETAWQVAITESIARLVDAVAHIGRLVADTAGDSNRVVVVMGALDALLRADTIPAPADSDETEEHP